MESKKGPESGVQAGAIVDVSTGGGGGPRAGDGVVVSDPSATPAADVDPNVLSDVAVNAAGTNGAGGGGRPLSSDARGVAANGAGANGAGGGGRRPRPASLKLLMQQSFRDIVQSPRPSRIIT